MRGVACALAAVLLFSAFAVAGGKKNQPTPVQVPELLLDGGRKLSFERSFSYDREVKPKKGFFIKVFDFVVGEPDFHFMVRPYSVTTDSRGRIIVTDPGAQGVHIFDFAQQKYKFIVAQRTSARIPCWRRNASPWTTRTTSTSPIRRRARSSSSTRTASFITRWAA